MLIAHGKKDRLMTNTAKRMIEAAKTEARKATLLAVVRRLHYDASIAQGFTPDDALTLCMESVHLK